MYCCSTRCTPEVVATTTGKNEDKKMRKVGEASLTPNHKIASEIQAIGERYTAVPVHSGCCARPRPQAAVQ
jgi:hypothetical protein